MEPMKGLFKLQGDPQYTAAFIEDQSAVLFPGSNGMPQRDAAHVGNLSDISENALFVKSRDETLLEAVGALKDNRAPRWTVKNF